MTLQHRLVGLGVAALLSMLTIQTAKAHELAAPGNSPSNPIAVLSVPDAIAAWEKIDSTPLGPALTHFFTESQALEDPDFVAWETQVLAAGEGLGFSLLPDELFATTLRGFDLYATEADPYDALVAVLVFYDAEKPGIVLDRIKQEARQAGGTSGGYNADELEDSTTNGRRRLDLPAFSLYFSASGNILTISTDREVLRTSIEDRGQATFTSEYFNRFNSGLETDPADFYFFGDPQGLLPLALRNVFNPEVFEPEAEDLQTTIARISIVDDNLKAVTYRPHEEMELTRQRLSRAAPPAAPIESLREFPNQSVFTFASNYFDGLDTLDALLESITGVPGTVVEKEQIEEQLSNSSVLFGFDIQNDLLANLGPEASFIITDIDTEGERPIWGRVSAAMVVGIRDMMRFEEVLAIFEDSATAPATANREEISFIKEGETDHGNYRFLEVEAFASVGFVPSYTVSEDEMLTLATNRELMEQILALRADEGGESLGSSSQYQSMLEQLSTNRNTEFQLNLGEMLALARHNPLVSKQLNLDRPVVRAALEMFDVLGYLTLMTIHQTDGQRNEFLLSM